MIGSVRTVGDFRRVLEAKVRRFGTLVIGFTDSMVEDQELAKQHDMAVTFVRQVEWLSWHSVKLVVEATAANESAGLLHYLRNLEANAEIPEEIKRRALDAVCQSMPIASRSTSPASNLAEDAKRAFWTEMAELLLKK